MAIGQKAKKDCWAPLKRREALEGMLKRRKAPVETTETADE